MSLSTQRWPSWLRPDPPITSPKYTPSQILCIFPVSFLVQQKKNHVWCFICLPSFQSSESLSSDSSTPPPLDCQLPADQLPPAEDHRLIFAVTERFTQSRHGVSRRRGVRSSQGLWPPFCQRWPHVKRVSAGVLSWVMCAKDLPPPLFEGWAFRGCEVQPFLFVLALFL